MSGGCQCGAVRYRATGELGYPHLCHCRMCQKAAGNYFMPLGVSARSDFALDARRADVVPLVRSGPARLLRRICGTPLFYEMPGADFINIGARLAG
jgi:hypothetical protein